MYCGSVVADAFDVVAYNIFHRGPLKVWAVKGPRIEQHLLNVGRQSIAIPDPKMIKLVPAEKESFGVEGRKRPVDGGSPLGHTVVVGVFSLQRKIQKASYSLGAPTISPGNWRTVGSYQREFGVPIRDQPTRDVTVGRSRVRGTENRSNEVIVEIRRSQ